MLKLNLEKQEVVIMTFGGKLQLLRKQKGMSQEQLASQLTVSRQATTFIMMMVKTNAKE
jgi:DNA-binding XRE family transcriptional regulator